MGSSNEGVAFNQARQSERGDAESHNSRGNLLARSGRFDEAIVLYRLAIEITPDFATAHSNLGHALWESGKTAEAMVSFQQAVSLKPNFAEAHYGLGNVLVNSGRLDDAVAAFQEAVRLKPDFVEAHNNLGNALMKLDRVDDSMVAYRKVLGFQPDHFIACNNLADALRVVGRLEESIATSRQAIAIKPDFVEGHNALGVALTAAKRFDEAIAELRLALRIRPAFVAAQNNLGAALYQAGRIDEAVLEYRRALAAAPDDPQVLANLGLGLSASGGHDEAIAAYREAIRIKSDFAEAHYNLSMSLLLKGEFEEGWRENEYRWLVKDAPSRVRACSQPMWNGEDLRGRTILVDAEQGFGDVIQFVRYIPKIAERGGRVIFMCYAELVSLLRGVPGIEQICSRNPPPGFDVHCPLLSLPRIFGTGMNSIPGGVPYLKADPAVAEVWRKKLGPRAGRIRVGLVWAGKAGHKRDGDRSLSLSEFSPLAEVEGATYYSLQKGDAGSQAKRPPLGMKLVDLTGDIRDFADTAGLISQLDLVVSADTAVAHLAGAMGKPVWTLVSYVPDWRWLLDRKDSPWYPTMRLFRQTARGEWGDVVKRVAEALG